MKFVLWALVFVCAFSGPLSAEVNLSGSVTVVGGTTPIERNALAMVLAEVQDATRSSGP